MATGFEILANTLKGIIPPQVWEGVENGIRFVVAKIASVDERLERIEKTNAEIQRSLSELNAKLDGEEHARKADATNGARLLRSSFEG